MSDTHVAPRWRVLFAPRWLAWHLFAVVAFFGMLWLGDWQFRRATGGNALSWGYTFEWPVFAIFGAVFWVKTIRDELHPAAPEPAQEVSLPSSAGPATDGEDDALVGAIAPRAGRGRDREDDEPTPEQAVELAEYNAYLAKLGRETHRAR
jgi:hypothetical protein